MEQYSGGVLHFPELVSNRYRIGGDFYGVGNQDAGQDHLRFGGTLNLVLGLACVLLSICPLAVIFHFYGTEAIPWETARRYLMMAYAWLALVTLALSVIPLRMGRRVLLTRDF